MADVVNLFGEPDPGPSVRELIAREILAADYEANMTPPYAPGRYRGDAIRAGQFTEDEERAMRCIRAALDFGPLPG